MNEPVGVGKEKGSRKEDEELRLLYQVTVQDLAFFKTQQWSIANYGLLLYAAIVAIPQIPGLWLSRYERLVLCLAVTVLAITGIYLIYKLERSITARRERLIKTRRLFTNAFCVAWRSKYKDPDAPTVSILLRIILVVGAGVVWWLVYFQNGVSMSAPDSSLFILLMYRSIILLLGFGIVYLGYRLISDVEYWKAEELKSKLWSKAILGVVFAVCGIVVLGISLYRGEGDIEKLRLSGRSGARQPVLSRSDDCKRLSPESGR